MANILFNTYCNRNCPYCFAREKVELGRDQGDSTKNLSMEGLEEIIDFYKRSQLSRFVILGGEPTLNPDFVEMVDRVLEEKSFSSVMIFSNGVITESVLNYLSAHTDTRIRVALNLNSAKDYPALQWQRVNRTMNVLGRKVGLGINVYQPGQEYDYLISAILKYGLERHIRVGITHPILGTENRYAREEDLPAIADDLVSFAGKTYENGISFSFDCGFKFCMFSLDQHRELLNYAVKFKSVCSPIVDVGPDLGIWRCFPLTNRANRRLEEFQNKREVIKFYKDSFNSYYKMGNTPDCPECRYRINGLCNGGCLARTIGSFNNN